MGVEKWEMWLLRLHSLAVTLAKSINPFGLLLRH